MKSGIRWKSSMYRQSELGGTYDLRDLWFVRRERSHWFAPVTELEFNSVISCDVNEALLLHYC